MIPVFPLKVNLFVRLNILDQADGDALTDALDSALASILSS